MTLCPYQIITFQYLKQSHLRRNRVLELNCKPFNSKNWVTQSKQWQALKSTLSSKQLNLVVAEDINQLNILSAQNQNDKQRE